MMSKSNSQTLMWSYQVNLDRRVRDDHPLRRINRVLLQSVTGSSAPITGFFSAIEDLDVTLLPCL